MKQITEMHVSLGLYMSVKDSTLVEGDDLSGKERGRGWGEGVLNTVFWY